MKSVIKSQNISENNQSCWLNATLIQRCLWFHTKLAHFSIKPNIYIILDLYLLILSLAREQCWLIIMVNL